MECQAPPLDAVAPDLLLAVDELRPPPPAAAEDVLLSASDGQPPPPDAVATEPPTVADEMTLLAAVEEDVVPVAADSVSSEAPEDGAGGVVLTDELRAQIVKQVH
jgi:La-related protein 7